jgi:hypothetical protein
MIDCGNSGHSLSAESPMTSERRTLSDSIERILLAQAVEIEEAIRGAKGLRGFLARALSLPSTTVFKSEIETVSQHVDKDGRVTVTKGEMPNAKMIFEGSHSSLCQMLVTVASERKLPVTEQPIKVTASGRFLGEVVFEIGTGEFDGRYLKRLPWSLGQ